MIDKNLEEIKFRFVILIIICIWALGDVFLRIGSFMNSNAKI